MTYNRKKITVGKLTIDSIVKVLTSLGLFQHDHNSRWVVLENIHICIFINLIHGYFLVHWVIRNLFPERSPKLYPGEPFLGLRKGHVSEPRIPTFSKFEVNQIWSSYIPLNHIFFVGTKTAKNTTKNAQK